MSYGAAGEEGRLGQLKGQVDQVKNVMRKNIDRVNERGDQLDELDAKADGLSHDANIFQKRAIQMRRKFWWQHVKLWLILICILAVVIVVVLGGIGGLVYYFVTK